MDARSRGYLYVSGGQGPRVERPEVAVLNTQGACAGAVADAEPEVVALDGAVFAHADVMGPGWS